jgi:hypothetical protein
MFEDRPALAVTADQPDMGEARRGREIQVRLAMMGGLLCLLVLLMATEMFSRLSTGPAVQEQSPLPAYTLEQPDLSLTSPMPPTSEDQPVPMERAVAPGVPVPKARPVKMVNRGHGGHQARGVGRAHKATKATKVIRAIPESLVPMAHPERAALAGSRADQASMESMVKMGGLVRKGSAAFRVSKAFRVSPGHPG